MICIDKPHANGGVDRVNPTVHPRARLMEMAPPSEMYRDPEAADLAKPG